MTTRSDYQQLLEQDVPVTFRVPGGAAAILKDGEVVAKHAWGYANLDTRELMTTDVIFPICSISKQMVCLILTELITERGSKFGDEVLDAVRAMIPATTASDQDLTLERLVDMQSGLRDYWALTVLWGATPQDRFSIYQDAPKAAKRLGGFHFAAGTQMSYCNTNFMLVGLAVEKVTGETLTNLLSERVFKPAGMKTAVLGADTSRIPPPVVAYEGSEEMGYIPYVNRIEWAGDAGVHACLEDMIGYEKYIHRNSTIEKSAYYKNAKDPKYKDGEPANYGHGLVHGDIEGIKIIRHSGGLPGFRLQRVFVPTHRLSFIVLLNSQTDTRLIVEHVLRKLLKSSSSEQPQQPTTVNTKIEISWTGNYLDEDAKLAVVIKQDKPGELQVNYDGHDEKLQIQSPTEAKSKETEIRFENDTLSITRPLEHRSFTARPLSAAKETVDAAPFLGKYYSEEVDSTLHITGSGSMLYGAFDGYLGRGPVHVMRSLGENVWWLACFRSLDNPVPGYWTFAFKTAESGNKKGIEGVTVGCWLARGVEFKRVEGN